MLTTNYIYFHQIWKNEHISQNAELIKKLNRRNVDTNKDNLDFPVSLESPPWAKFKHSTENEPYK